VIEIIDILLPVFGLMGVGYLAAWYGLMNVAAADGFSAYVHRIAAPLLVFRSIATTPAPDISPVILLLCYFGAVFIVWSLASLIARSVLKTDGPVSAMVGVGASYSNSVMLGMPLVIISYGAEGALIFFVIFPFHMPVMTLINSLQIEFSRGGEVKFGAAVLSTLLSMAKNPIIVGLVIGGIFRFSGLMLTQSADTITKIIADTAVPCALISMGLILHRHGIARGFKPALLMTVLKLGLLPALVWVFAAKLAGLDAVSVGVLTIFAAAPVGINVYIYATTHDVGVAEASSAIAISTVLSIATISIILALLGVG